MQQHESLEDSNTGNKVGRAKWLNAATIGYALIFLMATGAYLNTLSNEYTFDDQVIILKNPRIRQLTNFAEFFGTSYWDSPDRGAEYRPLVILSYAVNFAVNEVVFGVQQGLRPMTYHLFNVMLHALASALAAWAIYALFQRWLLAFLCGLFFALHPVHTEAVAGVVGRAEIMSAIGFFGALGMWGKIRSSEDSTKKWLFAALGGVAYAFGIFSKENALTLFGILVLDMIVLMRLRKIEGMPLQIGATLCRAIPVLAVFVLLTAAYFAARYSVLGGVTRSNLAMYGFVDNPAFSAPTWIRVFTAIRTQGEYLFLLAWPVNLIADFSFDAYPLSSSIMDTGVLLGLLALGGLLAAFAVGLVEGPIVAFAVGFYLITMSLTSNTLFPIGTIKAERLLYLPSLAFCLLLALIFEKLWFRFRALEIRILWVAAVATILGFYLAKTVERNPVWKNDKTLFEETIKAVPRNIKALNNLATALAAERRYDEAMSYVDMALRVQPDANYPLITKASLAARKAGDLQKEAERFKKAENLAEAKALEDTATSLERTAVQYYQKAIERYPAFVPALFGYGSFLCLKRQYDEGLDYLERALQIDPKSLNVLQQLVMQNWWSASGEKKEKRLKKTIEYGNRFLELSPSDSEAWTFVGTAHFELGNYEEAVECLTTALRYDKPPHDVKTVKVLGGAYYHMNRLVEAEATFEKALQIDPNDRDASQGLRYVREAQKTGVRRGLRESKAASGPLE